MFLTQLSVSLLEEARCAMERDVRTAKPLTIFLNEYERYNLGCWSLGLNFSFKLSEYPPQYRHAREILVGMSTVLIPGMSFRR
jgi:hypothetical protein